MKKERIYELALLLTLLFLALSAVSANIEISDMGHYEDIEGLTGYVNCQNVAECDLLGALLVFIDDEIVAGEIIKTRVRYVAGFRCAPVKTIEFPLNETEGKHHIIAHVFSMNSSIECTYDYYTEGLEEGIALEEESEQEEDWLTCWMCER